MSFDNDSRRPSQPGVLQVFKLKANHTKLRKNSIPLLFLAVTKNGLKAQYIKYQDLKRDFPHILIDFFEKKLCITNINENPPQKEETAKVKAPVAPVVAEKRQRKEDRKEDRREQRKEDRREQRKEDRREDRKQDRKEGSKDKRQVKQLKEAPIKERQHREIILMKDSSFQKEPHRQSIVKEERQPPKQSARGPKETSQTRPIRSCRYRNELLKRRDEGLFREETVRNLEEEDNNEPVEEVEEETDDEIFKRKSLNKILDYDSIIEQMNNFTLGSPAVIPTSKLKNQTNSIINFTLIPPSMGYSQMERQPELSEEFRESEESQFVIDERGKEKRKREKALREQERLSKKRKSKKIKKKRRPVKAA